MLRLALLLAFSWVAVGCGDDGGADASAPDAGVDGAADSGFDAASLDAGFDAALPIDAHFERPDAFVRHPLDDVLRLNHLQAEGTHNSYHLRPDAEVPDWDYSHAPLDVQLGEQGVRQLELDLYFDRAEGRWQVFHLPLVDDRTTCAYFLECLAVIRRWSDAHPGHHPVFVQIEPKPFYDEDTLDMLMAAMEEEILLVFPRELLITPDLVRGDAPNLREAVATRGWPTLGEVRGRVLFFLDCGREWCVHYANHGEGLMGKLLFANGELDDPWAAVVLRNDGGDAARQAVAAGRLVRTRAAGIVDALSLSTGELEAQRDAALATGAQMISSDVPAPRPDTGFFFEVPGGTPSRCNPVTAPAECTSEAIEDPSLLAGR